jgi:arylsulfatase A-like enzyme
MTIYPTLLELAGLPIPDHVEGPSIRKLLVEPATTMRRPALTTYLFKNHALRSARWRYIRYHDGTEELYDTTRDPNEWTNLAGDPEYAGVKAKFAPRLPKTDAPPGPKMEGAPVD